MKEPNQNNKMAFRRILPAVLLTILIAAGGLAFMGITLTKSTGSDIYATLQSTLRAARSHYETIMEIDESCNTFFRGEGAFYAHFAAMYLERQGLERGEFNALAEYLGDAHIYYKSPNGNLIADSASPPYPLDRREEAELQENGYIYRNGSLWNCRPCGEGYLCIQWMYNDSIDLNGTNLNLIKEGEVVFLADSETGIIQSCTDESMIGKNCSGMLSLARYSFISHEGFHSGTFRQDGIGYARYVFMFLDDGKVLAAYLPVSITMTDTLRSILIQGLLFLAAAGSLLSYALILRFGEKSADEEKLYFLKKYSIDKTMLSHLGGLLICCIVLLIALGTYALMLTSYSSQNVRATQNLLSLDQAVESNVEDRNTIWEYYSTIFEDVADIMAWSIQRDPTLLSQDGLTIMADIAHVDDVTVFNSSGVAVASSSPYTGYILSSDPENPESKCRQLLDGGVEKLTLLIDDEHCYIATRRQDAAGLLRISGKTTYYQSMVANIQPENAVFSTDFGNSSKVFIKPDNPTILHWVEAGSEDIIVSEIAMPENVLTNGYAGVHIIQGKQYYINTLVGTSYIYLSACPLREMTGSAFTAIPGEVGACVLIFLVLAVFLLSEHASGVILDKPKKVHHHNIREISMDTSFRNSMTRLILSACGLLALLLILDARFSSPSLLSYLFSSQWNHGLNLFSFTIILLTMVMATVAGELLQRLLRMVGRNMGPRGETISHMLSSMVKFGLLAGAIIYSLIQLGASLSALLTGAGFAGAAVALAARSIVDDMLSGFFIVFENQFRVGDWVTVGDWRGQVKEIGVRTTKIANGGDIRIFNNATLGGITVWGKFMSGALCSVQIDYKEDIEEVIRLIEQNREWYQREIPTITEGPIVHGVTELGDNGITIRIGAQVEDERTVMRTQREILRVTKRLFDEHDISIPFPQVQLHMTQGLFNSQNDKS